MDKLNFYLVVLIGIACLFCILPIIKEKKNKFHLLVLSLVVVLLPVVSLKLYHQWGSRNSLLAFEKATHHAQLVKAALQELKTPEHVITKLKAHLAKDPTSAKGWFLLGRLYFTTQQFKEAATAFEKANQLQADDTEIEFQYAQSLYFANHFQLSPRAMTLLQKILQTEPHHPAALNMLAINAYRKQSYQVAIQYWRQLLPLYNANSHDAQFIRQTIAEAEQKIKVSSPSKVY